MSANPHSAAKTEHQTERQTKGRPRAFDRETALRQALRLFWERGYEPASMTELCAAMGIKPPSLYAAFGNKARLFLEAVDYYEKTYWAGVEERFMTEPDLYRAVDDFFSEAARILLSPETPCGCLVVLAAVNISANEREVIDTIRKCRFAMKTKFAERLRRAIQDGQIAPDTDVPALAGALNTLLEGLSLQARDGLFLSELKAIAAYAVRLLPQQQEGEAGETRG